MKRSADQFLASFLIQLFDTWFFCTQALHYAAYYGHDACINVLLSFQAVINHQDADGISPLHWAALQGNASSVQLLLQNGANPNLTESNGSHATPLDYAQSGACSSRLA